MAGIAGIALPGRQQDVFQMLGKISHRGNDHEKMLEKRIVTMQASWPEMQELLAGHAESANRCITASSKNNLAN